MVSVKLPHEKNIELMKLVRKLPETPFEMSDTKGITRRLDGIVSSFPRPTLLLRSAHANFIGHPTLRRAASWKLFRDDEAGHRITGKGRGVLFHRQLPLNDLAV